MHQVTVHSKQGDYIVHIRPGILDDAGQMAASVNRGRLAMVVSDDLVGPLYLSRVIRSLKSAGFQTRSYMNAHGEDQKNMTTLQRLYRLFNDIGLSRTDLVIALGGGVIGDVTGFAAATYQRGVPFIQIPTSLLAQVDAAVGGKTAVDMPFGKNMVGAFYQPKAVLIDPDVLASLPDIRAAEGMAEVIKYGCIADRALFQQTLGGALPDAEQIARCVGIKADVVGRDETDQGVRMLLNFGHTLGHAVEKATQYALYTHGAAVAIGMVAAARIGARMGWTPPAVETAIREALEVWKLPAEAAVSAEEVLSAAAQDKKWLSGELNFIYLKDISKAGIAPLKAADFAESVRAVWLEAGAHA